MQIILEKRCVPLLHMWCTTLFPMHFALNLSAWVPCLSPTWRGRPNEARGYGPVVIRQISSMSSLSMTTISTAGMWHHQFGINSPHSIVLLLAQCILGGSGNKTPFEAIDLSLHLTRINQKKSIKNTFYEGVHN